MAKKGKFLGEVTIAKETDREYITNVPFPRGRKWRKLAPKLMKFVLEYGETSRRASEETDGDRKELAGPGDVITAERDEGVVEFERNLKMIEIIGQLWDEETFEGAYLPAVLGMEDAKGRKLLDEEFVMMDVVEPFLKASAMIMAASMGQPATQEALGKSDDDKPTSES